MKLTIKKRRETEKVLSAAREAIVSATPSIVGALIEGAKGGNAQQAKFLFEFAELSAAPEPGGGDGLTLARLLADVLRDLDATDEKNPAEGAATATAGG